MSEDQPSRQKFKWTKELVHIALNDGMTQEEIARVCRTQQSVVSSWKNGKNKATEQQLGELLRRYGARLNRTTARVYLVFEEPTAAWEETELGRALVSLRERRTALAAEIEEKRQTEAAQKRKSEPQVRMTGRLRIPRPSSLPIELPEHLIQDEQEDDQSSLMPSEWQQPAEVEAEEQLSDELVAVRKQLDGYSDRAWPLDEMIHLYAEDVVLRGRQRLVQIEGPVIFRYTFFRPVKRQRHRSWEIGREPIGRWLVHNLQLGRLMLVAQGRRELVGLAKERWAKELMKVDSSQPMQEWVECPDDAGRWLSSLVGPMTVEGLLQYVDEYLHLPETLHSPHDEPVLPYLLRKALVEHGHPVPSVDRITGLM